MKSSDYLERDGDRALNCAIGAMVLTVSGLLVATSSAYKRDRPNFPFPREDVATLVALNQAMPGAIEGNRLDLLKNEAGMDFVRMQPVCTSDKGRDLPPILRSLGEDGRGLRLACNERTWTLAKIDELTCTAVFTTPKPFHQFVGNWEEAVRYCEPDVSLSH